MAAAKKTFFEEHIKPFMRKGVLATIGTILSTVICATWFLAIKIDKVLSAVGKVPAIEAKVESTYVLAKQDSAAIRVIGDQQIASDKEHRDYDKQLMRINFSLNQK